MFWLFFFYGFGLPLFLRPFKTLQETIGYDCEELMVRILCLLIGLHI